jgi:hypothetical protein
MIKQWERGKMKTLFKSVGSIFFITLFAAASILGGCGGGGGGSGDFSSDSSSGSGNVALLLADGPADDYDEIWIKVTKVLLIPSNKNSNRSQVVIFESDEGHDVNLLELRDEDFLLTIKKRVPAGWYSKIRLEVKEIWAEGGPCNTFKLPSNRIDLNPRGAFEVRARETLAIRLDIDANKSINLHEAGNSGKCIFRPVVFVDIDTIKAPQRCPRILVGEITELLPSEDNIEGFTLDLFDRRGTIDVSLSDNPRKLTIIFGEDGSRVRRSALKPGQKVRVTGKINANGDLNASVVVIGDVLSAKGTVVTSVNNDSIFPLLLDPGQELVGGQVNVEITNATFILLGCDEEVDPAAIQRGKRARVVGKFDVNDNVLRAVAVFLKHEEIFGDLLRIERATGGTNLIIKDEDGNEISVFLPQDTPVYLQGDGEISLGLLYQLLDNCGSKKVRVSLDPEETEPTAREVRVQQEHLYGRVAEILRDRTVRLRTGQLVRVQEGATILLNTNRADIPVDFSEIRVGDMLTLYGLEDCDTPITEVDFYAFIVLINNLTEPPPSDDQCKDGFKPQLLEMQYTGEDCTASNNDQDPKKTLCEGDPNDDLKVFIRASDKEKPDDSKAKVWFEGPVDLNDTFDIDATNAGEDKLKSNTWVLIFDSRGGKLLQKINFHTSCSQPLAVGDQFGSLILEDIELVPK